MQRVIVALLYANLHAKLCEASLKKQTVNIVQILWKYCANIVHNCPIIMQIYYKYRLRLDSNQTENFYNGKFVSELHFVCCLELLRNWKSTKKYVQKYI